MKGDAQRNLRLLTHLIDARRNLRKAKSQATNTEDRTDVEQVLQHVEEQIERHVGEDWREL